MRLSSALSFSCFLTRAYFESKNSFRELLRAAGFELGHRDNTAAGIRELEPLVAERDLIVTGSSDYHGLGKPNVPGEHTTDRAMVERILAAGRGSAPVYP